MNLKMELTNLIHSGNLDFTLDLVLLFSVELHVLKLNGKSMTATTSFYCQSSAALFSSCHNVT